MQLLLGVIFLGLSAAANASISGPYLLWGHEKVVNLQPKALIEAIEEDFAALYRDAKAIVIFVRNNTNRLDGAAYPQLQKLVTKNGWAYLPQRNLAAEPFNYNVNVELINLGGSASEEDAELIASFNEAVALYGEGEVVGILANREDDTHVLTKREAKGDEDELRTTTAQTPTNEETEESFIYVADGKKAILYVNTAPILNITNAKESIKLLEHKKAITFDDQKAKHYGRLNIIFTVDGEKLFLRFNFSVIQRSWTMKAVEVEYKEYKTVLPIVGNIYTVPSAPVGFSYRCSAHPMIFTNGNDSLTINDYQVQPWLNGSRKFGDVYDCIGFTTSPIWAGVLVSFFLCSILAIGILALMDIKTPNRFESSRNKQLTFTTQE